MMVTDILKEMPPRLAKLPSTVAERLLRALLLQILLFAAVLVLESQRGRNACPGGGEDR